MDNYKLRTVDYTFEHFCSPRTWWYTKVHSYTSRRCLAEANGEARKQAIGLQ